MTKMIMVEDGNMKLLWECDNCNAKIKDKPNFEEKVSTCPKCDEPVDEFVSLFDENGDYA